MYIDTKAMIISVCEIMFPKDCIPNMEMNSDYIKNVLNGFFFPTSTPYFFFFFPTKFIHIATLLGISMGMLDACVPSHVLK